MVVLKSDSVDAFSQFLGWVYFIAWSISFYPQTILNFKRHAVTGLSLDFTLYNLTGFLFYTIYSITKYIEDQRAGAVQSVEPNDIAFGVHAVILTLVCLYQFHAYKQHGFSPMTGLHQYILSIFWVLTAYNLALILSSSLPFYSPPGVASTYYSSYSFVDYLGYSKAAISFIKYTPQAYLNYQRKSTVGWSIINILLDFTGGSLSFAQQFIDAWNRDDGGVIWGNVPKLLLALESMAFDVLFMVQHYVLYTNRADPTGAGSEQLLKKEYSEVSSQVNGRGVNGAGKDMDDEKKEHAVVEM